MRNLALPQPLMNYLFCTEDYEETFTKQKSKVSSRPWVQQVDGAPTNNFDFFYNHVISHYKFE